MALRLDELNRLTSNDVCFVSRHGSITSYGINHPQEHMSEVKRNVTLVADTANRDINFVDSPSTFRMLKATAWGGDIFIDVTIFLHQTYSIDTCSAVVDKKKKQKKK